MLPAALGTYREGQPLDATIIYVGAGGSLLLDGRRFNAADYPRGRVVTGLVKRVGPRGLTIEIEGWDGHVGPERLPADHPIETWRPGDEISGRVVDALAYKRLIRIGVGPFEPSRFPVGARATGSVIGVADAGLFVDLGHVVGFVPYGRERPGPRPNVGDPIEAIVEGTDPDREQINLTTRVAEQPPN
jgi:ribosomal protein S1